MSRTSSPRVYDILLLVEYILENAVAVGPGTQRPGGASSKIDVTQRNEDILITVVDNGDGFEADEKEQDLRAVLHHAGKTPSGIGLPSAVLPGRQVPGGPVSANSLPGEGTVFRITLPAGHHRRKRDLGRGLLCSSAGRPSLPRGSGRDRIPPPDPPPGAGPGGGIPGRPPARPVPGNDHMQLVGFRVTHYKVIHDTGHIKVDPRVTTFVGKNESGQDIALHGALEKPKRGRRDL